MERSRAVSPETSGSSRRGGSAALAARRQPDRTRAASPHHRPGLRVHNLLDAILAVYELALDYAHGADQPPRRRTAISYAGARPPLDSGDSACAVPVPLSPPSSSPSS